MTNMCPSAEQWTIYSAAQNLPAVLNDPNRGKQSNFFVKTWGDTFVERAQTHIDKSPFLPDITYAHFDVYFRKISKRYKRHLRLSQSKPENNTIKTKSKQELVNNNVNIQNIPDIFLKQTFTLNDPQVFSAVFHNTKHADDHILQEELSHYLDIVEVQIANQVSQKSGAFFHAMTSHDTIMEQMGVACNEVRLLRGKTQTIDKTLAKDSLRLIGLARSKKNHSILLDKLKLMSVVLQTQPTLQLLLSSSDYVAALELISKTQEVLSNELAGVTSLRHLPSQLKEMLKLIDKMLSSEFERYAAGDLHRPMNSSEGILEQERLISLVAGLLRQNHLQFLETYKQEAVTAAQALMKQLMIEELADTEDETEQCLTGSGEVTPAMDAAHWLKVLWLARDALGKLILRVKAVHDVIKNIADSSAGLRINYELHTEETEVFLSMEDHERVDSKLRDLLVSICDYCHERLALIVSTQSEKQAISSSQINELSSIVEQFTELSEKVCGRQSPALKAAFKIQAGNYVHRFHTVRKSKVVLLLDAERWKVTDVPPEFQILVDKLAQGTAIKSLPSSPISDEIKNYPDYPERKPASCLHIGSEEFVTVGTVLMLIRYVSEYCVCAYELQLLAPVVGRHLTELLRTFNSRTCQLVLGTGALRTAGLKTITSTALALTSRSLQIVLWMIPKIRAHFQALTNDPLSGFDSQEKDIGHHIQQLDNKVLSIIGKLLSDQLNEWDAKPPVPSKAFRSISRHLTKLHEAVSSVLPKKQVTDLYETIHKNFKLRLCEQLTKMNIVNNGGPQHGLVTTEIMFYLETMKNLKALPEKYLSDKSMDDIWIR